MAISGAALGSQAILLTYGRFFAEFLNEDSLVPLRLLASSTSVGLRYGDLYNNLRSFSWKALQSNQSGKTESFADPRMSPLKAVRRIFHAHHVSDQ